MASAAAMQRDVATEAATIEPAARATSLTERTVARAHRGLAGDHRGLRTAAAFAGPAVIASIAYMDPGNFATNIQAGAKYGYGLLWVVVLANLIAVLFQGLSAKLSPGEISPNCTAIAFHPLSCGRCGSSARSQRWRPTSPSSSAARSACHCCFTCRCSSR